MIYTLLNRDKDGNVKQIFSFESVQSFTESLRASVSSSTVEFGFPISDNISTENPTYSLNTVVSAYSLFNQENEIYWNGEDFVSQSSAQGENNYHIKMRDALKALWKDRQIVSILEGDKASFANTVSERYDQLTSKYYKEYENCAITSLEIDTGESSNGVIFLKMSIEQVDVAYVKFGQLQPNQMQPPLIPYNKGVEDQGTTKTSTTTDESPNKPDPKNVAGKSSDVDRAKNAVKTATQIDNESLQAQLEATETAVGLQMGGDPSIFRTEKVGNGWRLDVVKGKYK